MIFDHIDQRGTICDHVDRDNLIPESTQGKNFTASDEGCCVEHQPDISVLSYAFDWLNSIMEILLAWYLCNCHNYAFDWLLEQNILNTCGRIFCRQLLCWECNCAGGEPLLGRLLPPVIFNWNGAPSLPVLYNFQHCMVYITCLPSTVRPRVLCINLGNCSVFSHSLKRCWKLSNAKKKSQRPQKQLCLLFGYSKTTVSSEKVMKWPV